MAETPREDKAAALRRAHALNPRVQAVSDAAFTSGNAFFDARDLVQVKYEMLRRVREDGQTVSRAAADFGFSRPAFYQAQAVFDAAGLPGLIPQRPGPKRAHKLSEEVVDRLEQALAADPSLNSAQLARRLEQELGLRVHRRSVERALDRRKKRCPPQFVNEPSPAGELSLAYEALRAQATGQLPATTPRGLALFLTAGCPTWMQAWTPLAVGVPRTTAAPHRREASVGLASEVVQLLTQMAVGCQREWTA